MAVRIVAVYDNPTLLESFTSPVLTLPSDASVPNATLSSYYPGDIPGFTSVANCALGGEWCKDYTNPSPGILGIAGTYYFPRLLKPGIWTVSIELTLNTAGELPDPFDPETECEYFRFIGANVLNATDEDLVFPWLSTDAEGSCDFPDQGGTSFSADVGISDFRAVCYCGIAITPYVVIERGQHNSGTKSQLSSWDVTVSGIWVSDFPP